MMDYECKNEKMKLTCDGQEELVDLNLWRIHFDEECFKSLDSGIESLDDIGIKTLPKLGQMLQEFGNLSDQQKKVLQDGFNQLLWIFWKSGNKRSSLPKLELPDFIKKLSELTNND